MWQDKYIHLESRSCYFTTFNIVDSVDVFVRPVYKQIIVHTLNHFIESKGLIVHSWCLMSSYLHLIVQSDKCSSLPQIEKDFKQFTSNKILEAVATEPEARRTWMLKRFETPGNMFGFNKRQQVWEDATSPLNIDMSRKDQLLDQFCYVHNNPVRDRCVDLAADYPYSSARDYAGLKGLVNVSKPPSMEQRLAVTESSNGNFSVKYIRS